MSRRPTPAARSQTPLPAASTDKKRNTSRFARWRALSLSLVYLAFVINFVSCFLLAAVGVDVLTSIAAVAASMFNIGPGLGGVGPLDNYAALPLLAKWVLAACMVAGRLEFYTVLVIMTPAFWRK